MIPNSPPDTRPTQGLNPPENDALHLNPGVSQRKPRSVAKLCLWLTLLVCVTFGGKVVYSIISNIRYNLRHPHHSMYYDKPDKEVSDWSQVVRPMITKDSKFDVVASVWIRDDTAKDGTIRIDGEDHPERLLYSGTVFHNVHLKSKNEFANVMLSIPTSHFIRPNISNYDLRASFVIAQPDRPSWWGFVKNYTSWRPQGVKAPAVRKWEDEPSLVDEIYDSFGITIPLIQFHNITTRRVDNPTLNETADISAPENIERDTNNTSSDDESDWDDEELAETVPKGQGGKKENTFNLEFTGDQIPATEHHPYIVTRTEIRVADETKLFKRLSYEKAQNEAVNKSCVHPRTKNAYEHPQWYQCSAFRSYHVDGAFGTKVQLRMPVKSSESKNAKKRRPEWLYSPFMSATERAAGPKDLVPVPIDREAVVEGAASQNPAPGEKYVTVVWKLSFSSRTPDKLLLLDMGANSRPSAYNMTAPENKLQLLQHEHDLTMGLFGNRIDEDVHPRRVHILETIIMITGVIGWSLGIHYWYTRTSTTGISRLGTILIACNILIFTNERMLSSVLEPEATGHWLTRIPATYIFRLIPAFAMLKAAARLEFGWSTSAKNSREKGWIPRVYLAKATHVERASDRIAGRVSIRIKFALLITVFTFFHFLTPSSTYLLTPRIPQPTEPHPLHSLSPHSSIILECIGSLGWSLYVTGSTLQFVMNHLSRTYAGDYKIRTFLWFFSQLLVLLELAPRVVGRSTHPEGVSVADGIAWLIMAVDVAQAVRYRSVKSSDEEDEAR